MEVDESAIPFCLQLPYKWMYESTYTDFESDAYFDLLGLGSSQEEVDESKLFEDSIRGQVDMKNSDGESLSVIERNYVYPMNNTCRSKRKNESCKRYSKETLLKSLRNVAKKPTKIQNSKSNKELSKKDAIISVHHGIKAVRVVNPNNGEIGASGIFALGGSSSSISSETSDHEIHSQRKTWVVYLCVYCNKSLDHKSKLINHLRSHTNERPFECLLCGYRFRYKGNLVNHLCKVHGRASVHDNSVRSKRKRGRTRQGFVCCFCGKTFNDMKKTRLHVGTLHGELLMESNRS